MSRKFGLKKRFIIRGGASFFVTSNLLSSVALSLKYSDIALNFAKAYGRTAQQGAQISM
jgi:hypothetical protein